MNLGMREGFERGKFEFGGKGIDAGVPEEGDTGIVRVRNGGVALKGAVFVTANTVGKVFVVVKIFKDRTDSFEVVVQ